MLKFGDFLMEKFQKVLLYTIKTITHSIIRLGISLLCLVENIPSIIHLRDGRTKSLKTNKLNYSIQKKTGIRQNSGLILSKVRNYGKKRLHTLLEKNLSILRALPVELSQQQIVTQEESFALEDVTVVSMHALKEKEDVYNLHVEDQHEYFANGILVSNCFADLYSYLAMQGAGSGVFFGETEEKPPVIDADNNYDVTRMFMEANE